MGLTTPRIAPLPEAEWSDEVRELLPKGVRPLNIFTTLVRHPKLFKRWMVFGGHILSKSTLTPRDRELLILRTGYNCGSAYEWGQHVRISEALAISREEIMRVAEGPDAPGWAPAEAYLLRAADELHEHAKISGETWAALGETHDERGLIEIAMLVGHYHLVAFALNSLEVELDDGLEGLP
jgi:4-carboxymuconolactone decarboxylase